MPTDQKFYSISLNVSILLFSYLGKTLTVAEIMCAHEVLKSQMT